MSSNSMGTNIANAFKVVSETCENVNRLLSFLNQWARENDEYIPHTVKPLVRLRGDYNDEYVLVFQKKKDKKSLYVVDICLWNNETESEEPKVYISKYEYVKALNLNQYPISKGDFYQFSDPLCDDVTNFEYEDDFYSGTVKENIQAEDEYRGLHRVAGFSIPLVNINVDNAEEKVFGGFHLLVDK